MWKPPKVNIMIAAYVTKPGRPIVVGVLSLLCSTISSFLPHLLCPQTKAQRTTSLVASLIGKARGRTTPPYEASEMPFSYWLACMIPPSLMVVSPLQALFHIGEGSYVLQSTINQP